MATTISADNGSVSGSSGLKEVSDSSGILVLQTGANTTALTLDASQNAAFAGTTTVIGFNETITALSGTTPSINPATGTIQTWTLSGASTPTAASFTAGSSVTLMISAGANTVTWTSVPVTWVGGTAPTLSTTGVNVIVLWKVSSTIYGSFVGNT